jgi:hypothetical protein
MRWQSTGEVRTPKAFEYFLSESRQSAAQSRQVLMSRGEPYLEDKVRVIMELVPRPSLRFEDPPDA